MLSVTFAPPPLTVSDAIVLHTIYSHPNDIYSPHSPLIKSGNIWTQFDLPWIEVTKKEFNKWAIWKFTRCYSIKNLQLRALSTLEMTPFGEFGRCRPPWNLFESISSWDSQLNEKLKMSYVRTACTKL